MAQQLSLTERDEDEDEDEEETRRNQKTHQWSFDTNVIAIAERKQNGNDQMQKASRFHGRTIANLEGKKRSTKDQQLQQSVVSSFFTKKKER